MKSTTNRLWFVCVASFWTQSAEQLSDLCSVEDRYSRLSTLCYPSFVKTGLMEEVEDEGEEGGRGGGEQEEKEEQGQEQEEETRYIITVFVNG